MAFSIIEKRKRAVQRTIAWRNANRAKWNESRRKYVAKNREKINAKNKKWAREHRDAMRVYSQRYFSIPKNRLRYKKYMEEWHRKRREKLTGLPKPSICPVCRRKGKMVVDHCHKTQKIRGWICDSCNVALGRVNDSIATLKALIHYLEK